MTVSRSTHFALPLAALLVSMPAKAHDHDDKCRATIATLNGASIATYDALANGDYVAPMQIVVRNTGDQPCAGAVFFSARRSDDKLKGPRQFTFDYLVVGESNANQIVYDPIADDADPIPVIIPARGSVTLRPQLRVAGGQPGESGRYTATIEARFKEAGDDHRGGPGPETSVTLTANAVPSVQANFSGLDGGSPTTATLALGELSKGLERDIGLQLRSNADVDVTVDSTNDGALVRVGGADRISYRLAVGRKPVNLHKIDEIKLDLIDPGDDSVRLKTRRITITVGDTANARAGTYNDTVTFRISAR